MATLFPGDGSLAPAREVRSTSTRGELFFWTALVLIINALAGLAATDINHRGLAVSAFDLFGISAMILVACVGALILVKDDTDARSKTDIAIIALCVGAALLPNNGIARLMVSVLGIYLIFIASRGSKTRRAGIVMLAIGGALFWGPFLLGMLGHPILELDAKLTSWLYGLDRVGNTLGFAGDAPGSMIIVAGCSSWHGLSIALLFWALLYQWFEIPVRKSSFIWLALAMALTIAVNSLRLAAMASFPENFDEIHTGYGATIANWVTMALVVGTCIFGARREIFAR